MTQEGTGVDPKLGKLKRRKAQDTDLKMVSLQLWDKGNTNMDHTSIWRWESAHTYIKSKYPYDDGCNRYHVWRSTRYPWTIAPPFHAGPISIPALQMVPH